MPLDNVSGMPYTEVVEANDLTEGITVMQVKLSMLQVVKMSLMDVADVARHMSNARSEHHKALYKACRAYIVNMSAMPLPSGGVIGGVNAFVSTSDVIKTLVDAMDYKNKHGLPHYVVCEKVFTRGDKKGLPHGRQKVVLAHVFPRSFGGVFDGVSITNIRGECQACNHEYSDSIDALDVKYLDSIEVTLTLDV